MTIWTKFWQNVLGVLTGALGNLNAVNSWPEGLGGLTGLSRILSGPITFQKLLALTVLVAYFATILAMVIIRANLIWYLGSLLLFLFFIVVAMFLERYLQMQMRATERERLKERLATIAPHTAQVYLH